MPYRGTTKHADLDHLSLELAYGAHAHSGTVAQYKHEAACP